jgi:hypothetical protein
LENRGIDKKVRAANIGIDNREYRVVDLAIHIPGFVETIK